MLTLPNVTQAEIDAVASISKDEREQLVAKINATDPHKIFTPALSKSTNENVHAIICPQCGNGSGENHTPVEVELIGGKWIYNCYKCGNFQGDLLGIIADNNGLNLKAFNGLCEAIAIGLKLVGDALPAEIPAPNPKSAAEIEFEKREKAEIKGDIEYAQNHLGDLPIRQERGLSFETLRHFGCGYFANWTHPKTRLSEKDAPSSRRLIIPTGDTHYNAVALPADRPNMKKNFHKMHAGKMSLFGLETVGNADIVVVVEGEIDAMSIYQASKVAVIAVLGAANWQATLKPVLTQKFTGKRFIILFDDDEAGKNNATNFKSALAKRFFPATVKSLADYLSDTDKQEFGDGIVIDANVILQKRGDKFLASAINKIVSDAKVDFLKNNDTNNYNAQNSSAQVNSANTDKATKKKFTYRDFLKGTADQGNAKRLMKFIDGAARWLEDVERWLIWRPSAEFKSGGVWRKFSKENHAISPFASKFADFLAEQQGIITDEKKELHDRAYEEIIEKDEKTGVSSRKLHVKDAAAAEQYEKALKTEEIVEKIHKNFCSANKVSAAITMLKAQESIRITEKDLDRYPELLNTRNGVVNLQDGKLYPADPSLYLTQQCSVDFDPRADFSFIQEFFAQIQPDEMTRAALKRWLGYCLSGSICEEKFMIWLGKSGANGKGVLSKAVSTLLADYATSLPRRALIFNKFATGDSHTAGLNSLPGSRFAISEELAQNLVLDSALIKSLTGGDLSPLRPMFKELTKEDLHAKLNMSSNFLPKFENVDDGGWLRRILVMPFNETFTGDRANPHLKEQMLTPENQRGLLRLLVTEATAWYREDRLIISTEMQSARKENLDANDYISDFLSEYTEKFEGGQITRKILIQQLRDKCSDARRFSDAELTTAICKRGIEYVKTREGRIFKGIRFTSATTTDIEPPDFE